MNRSKLTLVAYAPPLEVGDDRPSALLEAFEKLFPEDRMNYTVSTEGVPLAIQNREAFLQSGALRGEIPLISNGLEDRHVSVFGHAIPAVLTPGGAPLLHIAIVLPETIEYVLKANQLLLRACERMRAYWGVGSPNETAAKITEQTVFPGIPIQPPLGLPALLPPQQMASPILPQRFGWLNYWSAEAASALEFPNDSNDAAWFAEARRGADGGWILKLTDSPLDLTIPEHLERLKKAYARFPTIGRR